MIEIQNPGPTRLETSTWNLESVAWNPEFKAVLDSLTRGDSSNRPFARWRHLTTTLYNNQNPSGYCFLLQITSKALVFKTHGDYQF